MVPQEIVYQKKENFTIKHTEYYSAKSTADGSFPN